MDGSVLSRPLAGEGASREFALIRYRGHKIDAVDLRFWIHFREHFGRGHSGGPRLSTLLRVC